MSLGGALDARHNSLNALRLLLALLVVVSHAPLAGGYGQPPMIGDIELGGWAVSGFFAISGWLITSSRLRLRLGTFVWRRVLRIYPGFWMSLIVVAFGFAPLAVVFGGGTYRLSDAAGFVVKNLTLNIVQPSISGSLAGSDYQSHWNLSLWTLRWEFLCYLGVALLLGWAWARRHRWVLPATWILVSAPYAAIALTDGSPSTAIAQASRLGGYFLAGAVAYRYRDKIPASIWLAAASAAGLGIFAALGVVGILGAAPMAYLCLWLGAVLPLQRVGRDNDVSYGVYIYAFPTQLLLAIVGVADTGAPSYIAVSIVAVLVPAWASWKFVERPALRLKSRSAVRSRSGAPLLGTVGAVLAPSQLPIRTELMGSRADTGQSARTANTTNQGESVVYGKDAT